MEIKENVTNIIICLVACFIGYVFSSSVMTILKGVLLCLVVLIPFLLVAIFIMFLVLGAYRFLVTMI
jgi:hypothetical protein